MGASGGQALRGWRRASLVTIKTVHTVAFFSIGSCLAYLAYSALAKRSDRRAAIAGVVVTGETLVYALNGFRCPLTDFAERLGSEHGSVADIYLPRWIEDHLPYITGPIFAGAVTLHARNILQSRAGTAVQRTTSRVGGGSGEESWSAKSPSRTHSCDEVPRGGLWVMGSRRPCRVTH